MTKFYSHFWPLILNERKLLPFNCSQPVHKLLIILHSTLQYWCQVHQLQALPTRYTTRPTLLTQCIHICRASQPCSYISAYTYTSTIHTYSIRPGWLSVHTSPVHWGNTGSILFLLLCVDCGGAGDWSCEELGSHMWDPMVAVITKCQPLHLPPSGLDHCLCPC